ncbi:MAG: TldD/PmbA family protein [Candidatus Thorarchaeota archaeon]
MDFKKELLLEKAGIALSKAEALGVTQAEVEVSLIRMALTRLANSIIDQNIVENRAQTRVLLYLDKQKGSVSIEALDHKSITEAAESAIKMARVAPEDKDFKSLPPPKPYFSSLTRQKLVCQATADATPEERAEFAATAIQTAHGVDERISTVAGAISNYLRETVIANSLGVEAYQASTGSDVNLTIMGKDGADESAGWAEDSQRDFRKLNVVKVAETAANKAASSFGVKALKSGDYEAILEPASFAELGLFMIWIGFSALAYQEYRSFLRNHIGERMFSDKLTLWDDGLDNRFPTPQLFDDEGYPKSRLNLIDNGVVKNLLYDSYTAGKDDEVSTGHNTKTRGASAPFARHLITKEGKFSIDEMIADTKRGILITHFHYTNPVDPTKGMLTGLTRDGTWLIENGEIEYPVGTLRFTDAIPRILAKIDMIGKYPDLRGSSAILPPLKVPSFRVTGSSQG